MATLPSGTVTFLFSDVEGSTQLLKRLGDRYGAVLDEHRRLMRETFAARGGVEIDTQGDAFFFAFPRARDAVTAAVEAQRAHAEHEWPDGASVRVRMGLHTGEPAVGSEGYLGLDVVRAARLCTAGDGGHVLLSEATRALVGGALPEGASLFPLGERRLKGLDEPERVFELEIEGVTPPPADVPSVPAARPPAPEPAPPPPAPPAEDFGNRLAARIEQMVQRKVESSLERAMSNVDALAERAADDPERIADKLDDER